MVTSSVIGIADRSETQDHRSFTFSYFDLADRAVAEALPSRKVRTSQGKAVGNADPGKLAGQCHRKHTAYGRSQGRPGKVEKVR